MKTTDKAENDTLDFLVIFNKWKHKFLLSVSVVLIIAVIFSLLLTKKYKATALFLPPSTSSGLSSLIENFSFDILGGEDITGEMCLSVLNSRGLRTEIIKKYDLMKLYNKKYIEHALKVLDKNVLIESEMQVGIGSSSVTSISISVIDESPERAANMANDFIKMLEMKIIDLNTIKAKNNRLFLQKRVDQNASDLTNAENTLKDYQEKRGAIEITAQAQAAIETAAKLKAELIKAKTIRDALMMNLGKDNAQVQKAQNEIDAITKEYELLHDGFNDLADGKDVMMPINELPKVGLHYFRLLREVKIQNKLNEMLVPLYEQAKIQEEKNIPILRVVDYAVPPTYKFKPKRVVIVIGFVAVYSAMFYFYIFFIEYLNHLKYGDIEKYRKIANLFKYR
jgi:tyrosine-protein kinase Etk/Wzc